MNITLDFHSLLTFIIAVQFAIIYRFMKRTNKNDCDSVKVGRLWILIAIVAMFFGMFIFDSKLLYLFPFLIAYTISSIIIWRMITLLTSPRKGGD